MTNMMKFWRSVKDEHSDCIVLFRLGDFYEMFFEDAEKASKILDLTLTGRDCGEEKRAPMCGIPYHAADGYIAKLVENGCRVAICEQLSDPKKGPVDRGVVRIVTRGTVTDCNFLDEKKNNYIACCYEKDDKFAFAYADITTGEFCVAEESSKEKLISALVGLSVSEIIANNIAYEDVQLSKEVQRGILPSVRGYFPWSFERERAAGHILEQFPGETLSSLGIEDSDLCIGAAGALLEFLLSTQKHSLKIIETLKVVTPNDHMVLDSTALRTLDILKNNSDGKRYGSLLWLLDKTKTGMGARKLCSVLLKPLCDKAKIEERLKAVGELFEATVVRMGISEALSEVYDIERLAGKVSNKNLQPRDCVQLCKSLSVIPALKLKLAGFSSKILKEISSRLADTKEICALLESAFREDAGLLREGNFIKPGFNKQLDTLRELSEDSKEHISMLEATEREKTGIRALKVGYNRVFGYYIEVPKASFGKVPLSYTPLQTISTGQRFTNEALKRLEKEAVGSSERASIIEQQLFDDIFETLEKNIPVLVSISQAIATLDCVVSLATVAKENNYVCPTIVEEGALKIKEGRHPVVEAISKERFVPNDIHLDAEGNRTLVITGPNMAGKSTYLRQTALIVLLAHIGSFVPAEKAQVPLCDRIFTRIGAADNLILDRSTFLVEMTEVAEILKNATKRSLVILDEVGRGTSTYDGLSIARAIIEYINENIRAKTLFATHYHELTELEGKISGIKNYKVSVREANGNVIFLRKIVRGGASRSFGVEVAAMAGVPEDVIFRAKDLLKALEKGGPQRSLPPESGAEEKAEEKAGEDKAASLLANLRQTNPDLLSPMQALSLLSEWKETYK